MKFLFLALIAYSVSTKNKNKTLTERICTIFCNRKEEKADNPKFAQPICLTNHDDFFDINNLNTYLINKPFKNKKYHYKNPIDYIKTYDDITNRNVNICQFNAELDQMNSDLLNQLQTLQIDNFKLYERLEILKESNDLLKSKINGFEDDDIFDSINVEKQIFKRDNKEKLDKFNIKNVRRSLSHKEDENKNKGLSSFEKKESDFVYDIEEKLNKIFANTDEVSLKSFDCLKKENIEQEGESFENNLKKRANDFKDANLNPEEEYLKNKMDVHKLENFDDGIKIVDNSVKKNEVISHYNKNNSNKNFKFPLTSNVNNIINRIQLSI